MLTLGLVLVASIASILALSAVALSRSEISYEMQLAKEAAARRKLEKINRFYAKERQKERERLDSNMSAVDKLFEESSIDNQTRERYKKILQIDHEHKCQQIRTKFGKPRR